MRSIEITDKGTVRLSGGILRLCWRPNQTVGADEARLAASAIADLGQGTSLPLLIQVHGVSFTRAARKVAPEPGSVSRIALVGSSPVDYAVALFLLRVTPLPCPVVYFTSVRKALHWLRRDTDPTMGGHGRPHI